MPLLELVDGPAVQIFDLIYPATSHHYATQPIDFTINSRCQQIEQPRIKVIVNMVGGIISVFEVLDNLDTTVLRCRRLDQIDQLSTQVYPRVKLYYCYSE